MEPDITFTISIGHSALAKLWEAYKNRGGDAETRAEMFREFIQSGIDEHEVFRSVSVRMDEVQP